MYAWQTPPLVQLFRYEYRSSAVGCFVNKCLLDSVPHRCQVYSCRYCSSFGCRQRL